GANHMVAVILQPFVAIGAMLAAVDDAAYADQVAGPMARYVLAHRDDAAHDLVAWHAGVKRAFPLRTHLMKIGMAHAAIVDGDLYVMRSRSAAGDFQRFERKVARMGAV